MENKDINPKTILLKYLEGKENLVSAKYSMWDIWEGGIDFDSMKEIELRASYSPEEYSDFINQCDHLMASDDLIQHSYRFELYFEIHTGLIFWDSQEGVMVLEYTDRKQDNHAKCQTKKRKILKRKIGNDAFMLFCVVVGGGFFLYVFTDSDVMLHTVFSSVVYLLALYYFIRLIFKIVLYKGIKADDEIKLVSEE